MSESSFRSPFAALVWKEWRESWWLLMLVVAAPTALYLACVRLYAAVWIASDSMVGTPAFSLWALLLSLGARLFAGARANGTSAFQLERPVSRETIWNATLAAPILACAAGTILFTLALATLSPRNVDMWNHHVTLVMFCTFAFVCFASAVFCSVILPRSITAWASGGVLSFVLVLAQWLLIDAAASDSMSPGKLNFPWVLYLLLLNLEALGLLWLSRVAYVRWMRD